MNQLQKALRDPTQVYELPAQVLLDTSLTRAQKIEVLRRWEYDARELEVAEEEAGMGVKNPEMFDLVVKALRELGADRDVEHSPPTK